jgi:hypothetical protein
MVLMTGPCCIPPCWAPGCCIEMPPGSVDRPGPPPPAPAAAAAPASPGSCPCCSPGVSLASIAAYSSCSFCWEPFQGSPGRGRTQNLLTASPEPAGRMSHMSRCKRGLMVRPAAPLNPTRTPPAVLLRVVRLGARVVPSCHGVHVFRHVLHYRTDTHTGTR